MLRVIGLGAGGHARGVLEILQRSGKYEIVGLLEADNALHGKSVAGAPVLGGDDLLPRLQAQKVTHAFIGVGTVGDTRVRQHLYNIIIQCGFEALSVIHPQAVISPSAVIGQGFTMMPGAVVNWGAQLGANVIVNTHAVIEHDCMLGDHVHIATGALLAGGVTVGAGTHIGIGATVRQGIQVGQNVIVGAGAVVVCDLPDNVVVAGVPARVLRHRNA